MALIAYILGDGNVSADSWIRTTRFASISSGTSGTVTPPSNSTIILDDFGGTTDAVVVTISGGRPTYDAAVEADGTVVATTFDSSGNYALTGTPSAYPVAIVYRVRQQLKHYNGLDSDIVGPPQIEGVSVADALIRGNNLSDVDSVSTSRTNLGLGTGDSPQFTAVNVGDAADTTITRASAGVIAVEGSNVLLASGLGSITQAYDADLAAIAALSNADNNFIVGNGVTWVAESGATARTSLGLGTAATTASTDYLSSSTSSTQTGYFGDIKLQDDTSPSHYCAFTIGSNLTADRTLTINVDDSDRTLDISAANVTISTFGASLVDDAAASNARTTLGLGTSAVIDTGTSGTKVPLLDGTNTWSAVNTFTTASTSVSPVTIECTDAGAGVGPFLDIYRNSASPAASDILGRIRFRGNNTTPAVKSYAVIYTTIIDATPASEDANLIFDTSVAGSNNIRMQIAGGVFHPSATGTDKGDNTLNYGTIYENGTSLVSKYQGLNANLTAISGLTTAADKVIYWTGSGTASTTDLTSVARTLIAQTTQANMRTTGLGLGTAATQNTGTSGTNVPLLDGINTWSGSTNTFSSTSTAPFVVQTNDDGNSIGPRIVVYRNSASPAALDSIGGFTFQGKDTVGTTTDYVQFNCQIEDPTDGAESGRFVVSTKQAGGSLNQRMYIGLGIYTAARSDQGTNTINATTLYETDVSLVNKYASLSTTSAGTLNTFTSTNGGATAGPVNILYRDSASPAANDFIGATQFDGEDSAGNQQTYGLIGCQITDATSTSEDANLYFQTVAAGTVATRMTITAGVTIGSPTGGDQGAGTLNATGVYDDGVLLTCPALQPEFLEKAEVDLAKWDAKVPDKFSDEGIALEKSPHESALILKQMVDAGFDPRSCDQYLDKMIKDRALPGMPTEAEWVHNSLSVGSLTNRKWLAMELMALALKDLSDRLKILEAS